MVTQSETASAVLEKEEIKSTSVPTVKNYINGSFVQSSSTNLLDITDPSNGMTIAKLPLSTKDEFDDAVRIAKDAFPGWRKTPPLERARYFFKLKTIMEDRFDDIARVLTIENGKTFDEARGSVRRAIENVEVAAGIPTLMQGYSLEDVASGIDTTVYRQPIGVFAAITPFNFPAMVPMWFLPYAVATGNTFILKPSEQVPLTQNLIFELMDEIGLPPGVINLVHGDKVVVDAICTHPDIAGVSFVGSSPVAQHVYSLASQNGKRVQALGGAKNFVVVMDDADIDAAADAIVASCFGCAGERCLAASMLLGDEKIYDELRTKIVEKTSNIKLGSGLEEGVTMGPVVTSQHREKVLSYIEKGLEEGAEMLLDGRNATVEGKEDGYFLGPTIFDNVDASKTIAKEEIFGPVLTMRKVSNLDDAIEQISMHPLANTISIFTKSGANARKFRYNVDASMIGVNIGVPAPMSFFTFGGAKGSFFGDLKAHGRDSIEFYTDKKVVTSRW